MWQGKRVAVVVPAYNEAERIARTLATIPAWVDHVVAVDDASEDGTGEAVTAAAQGATRVELVRHPSNRGVGAAIATGFAHATDAGADLIAVMAGDGQMDPEDLPSLLEPLAAGRADFAKGSRFYDPRVRAVMPWTRWVGNVVLSALTRAATGLPISDSQCGYVAVTRAAAERLDFATLWPRYGYPNDLLARAAHARVALTEVGVRTIYAGEQSGVRLHHALFVVPWVIWRARRGERPAPGAPWRTARLPQA